jgi:lipopolysaccharide heptosyltransferase II
MSKINFLKLIDIVIGRTFCLLFPKSFIPEITSHVIENILIIRPGGIGDAVMTLPLIIAIKKSFADVKIDILAEKRNHSIYTVCPGIRNVYLYDHPKHLITAIRNTYDIVIDTEQWHRLSAVMAKLGKPSILIGFDTNERRRLLTHAIPYSHENYEVNSFIKLLAPLGIKVQPKTGEKWIEIPPDIQEKADNLLTILHGKQFISLFPGASIAEKRWDKGKFTILGQKLNSLGFEVAVIGASSEVPIGEFILSKASGLNLAGKTSLLESAGVIQNSRLLISGDSGVLHMAAGLRVSTVSLFGPSNVKKWAPKGDHHIVVSKNLPCSPCSRFGITPKCQIKAGCMANITVDEVVEAVKKLIESERI